ncbi:hypothetical protein QAD02_018012 [Eretmocerus hayati]|uniref:Uncharacterized protein n=1 Tax=Eretmocerus hayati TaxID=131215 RepID=A0ACC2PFL0_9HYME|nr:hypothetical protein QAD02_018012 [Eretmocerus hayati]
MCDRRILERHQRPKPRKDQSIEGKYTQKHTMEAAIAGTNYAIQIITLYLRVNPTHQFLKVLDDESQFSAANHPLPSSDESKILKHEQINIKEESISDNNEQNGEETREPQQIEQVGRESFSNVSKTQSLQASISSEVFCVVYASTIEKNEADSHLKDVPEYTILDKVVERSTTEPVGIEFEATMEESMKCHIPKIKEEGNEYYSANFNSSNPNNEELDKQDLTKGKSRIYSRAILSN